MEILIVGFIIVALMAYVSTKIKNAAKRAYEPENVATETFTITKPEGFIVPIKEKSEFAFETYSKDFGEDETGKFNQCWAFIKEKEEIENNSEFSESEKVEDGVTIKRFTKILTDKKLRKNYELEILALPEYYEQYSDRIKLMLNSFSLK